MIIDGVNTLDYGLVPLKVSGAYDMPSRLSPYLYDWGDEIQPLLLPSQMSWEGRNIEIEFLYDISRATSANKLINNFLDVMTRYYTDALPFNLELTEKTGSVGVYNVVVSSIGNHLRYRNGYSKINFRFFEQVPSFAGVLPTLPVTTPSISLGGYGFSQFGIIISKLIDISGIGEAKESPVTTYNKSAAKSQYRGLHAFKMNCYCVGTSPTDVLLKISSFQKLLTSNSLLNFRYGDFNFDTFAATGFKATKKAGKIIQFELTLFRV